MGAGPSDPELLTLQAHRLLRSCDALVHDSLMPKALLDLARSSADMIFTKTNFRSTPLATAMTNIRVQART